MQPITFTDLQRFTKVYLNSGIKVYSFTPPLKGVKRKSITVTQNSEPSWNFNKLRSINTTIYQIGDLCNLTLDSPLFCVF
jgi:hypothetical protein